MKLLIIAINRSTFPYVVAPLGAAAVTAAARDAGHRAELLDLCFKRNPRRALRRAIGQLRPEVVGLSIRNLDSCSYHQPTSYLDQAERVVRWVRRATSAPLVLGGAAVTVVGAKMVEALGADYGVIGEGERSLPRLLSALERGDRLEAIPGLVAAGEPGARPPEPIEELDDLPVNDQATIDFRPYLRRGGMVGVQTKRGCPFRCLYCNYPSIEGARYRLRSAERCVEDIERLVVEQGLRDVFFTDSVFNQPRDQALSLCHELARRRLGIRWQAYCNPLGLDSELARAFAEAGCVGVELGIDAVLDRRLEALGKSFGEHEVAQASAALEAAGIPFAHFLIFGGPGERWADVEASREQLRKMSRANAVFAGLGLRVYRSTALYGLAVDQGLVTPGSPALKPVYYLSPTMRHRAVERLDQIAARTTTWMTPTDWDRPLIKLVHNLSGRLGAQPPWRRFEEYGKHMRRHGE